VLDSNEFLSNTRRACINFHSNPANFKADGRVRIAGKKKKKMAAKIVDRTFLQGQSAELFRAAIKSHATRDPSARKRRTYQDSASFSVCIGTLNFFMLEDTLSDIIRIFWSFAHSRKAAL